MAWDRDAFENAMIEDMRAHDGVVTSGPLAGHPLLILTSTGAKSGEPRRAILTFTQDAGDYVVAGTAGRRRRPSWPTGPSATGCGTGTSPRCRTSPTIRSRPVASSR